MVDQLLLCVGCFFLHLTVRKLSEFCLNALICTFYTYSAQNSETFDI